MKRAASYSDSFLILGKHGLEDFAPILIPSDTLENEIITTPNITEIQQPTLQPKRSRAVLCFLFTFKGSFHLLLISAFETLFYFLYVNKSENTGILNTINTYYDPIVENCQQNWSNTTKWLIYEVLTYDVNIAQVDSEGFTAARQRTAYNQSLLVWSSMYSVICLVICMFATVFVRWQKWVVPWKRMLLENFMFVLILGIYEVFFFRTIIYNYDTLSTSELNKYILDGLEHCSATP